VNDGLTLGIWSAGLRYGDAAAAAADAAELEALGYRVLWIPDVGGPVFEAIDRLLDATSSVTIATGILNIWQHEPADVVAWWSSLTDARRDRVLLGLGVSHGPLIGERWTRPLATMTAYLDALDRGGVPRERRCLAALGPKMLALSAARSAGAHPYLVTPEHTATARPMLDDAGLFVEQGAVFEEDAEIARGIARTALEIYCGMPNYVNNWKRLGFTDDEIASRSDRLVDGLIVWGDAGTIRERVDAHRRAGADHVCIQVLNPDPHEGWRALAPRR
jgi:probable F420-dependent oxidoreductase